MARVHRKGVKTALFRRRKKVFPVSARRKARRHREPSELEKKVYQILDDLQIPYEREKPISRIHVDIFIEPKYAIELNGCYWHGCESCNRELDPKQQQKHIEDGRRYNFLRKQGYDVIVIWEHEVEENPERVIGMLQTIYDLGHKKPEPEVVRKRKR